MTRTTISTLLASARTRLARLDPHSAHRAVSAGGRLIDIRAHSQIAADGVIPGALIIHRNVLEWRLDPRAVTATGTHPGSRTT